ncbi:MAG: glycosyltransferase [Prevotella sp.]|nr:glycosyltransferase [Prevotella sp.]
MKQHEVAILMATYNGERFLREQIESILAQTSQDWHLYIHDDGSNDQTPVIIQKYAGKYPELITTLSYPPQGGACHNFLSMLNRVEAHYYMFADQDDRWHSNKVEHCLQKMKEVQANGHSPEEMPLIVHCNLRIADEQLNIIHDSFWDACQLHPEIYHSLKHRVSSIIPGCTMLFNHKVKDIVGNAENAIMHDYWLTVRTLAAGGQVMPLAEQLMDYRQHTDNAIGVESCYKTITGLKKLARCKYLLNAHKENYRMLHAAGYGSKTTYWLNKAREFVLVKWKEMRGERNERG